MKIRLLTLLLVCLTATYAHAGLILTGVVDGPRTGGFPKAIELFATSDIADLSIYNIETPNNGGTSSGFEFALSGSAMAGDFIWVSADSAGFEAYFGFAPTLVNSVANINGDDNVILYENGVTIDQFGVNGQDGTGTAWEYLDGFAYRNNNTGPDSSFAIGNWTFSGINALDPQGTSGVNGSAGVTVPFGTFQFSAVPEPASMLLLGVTGVGGLAFRRFRRKSVSETIAS